jgi:hypothetical protein
MTLDENGGEDSFKKIRLEGWRGETTDGKRNVWNDDARSLAP